MEYVVVGVWLIEHICSRVRDASFESNVSLCFLNCSSGLYGKSSRLGGRVLREPLLPSIFYRLKLLPKRFKSIVLVGFRPPFAIKILDPTYSVTSKGRAYTPKREVPRL